MANHGNCDDCDLGAGAAQTRTGERQNLRRAMKRAAKAQRRLNEAIYLANAGGEGHNTSSSSSESDGEGQHVEDAAVQAKAAERISIPFTMVPGLGIMACPALTDRGHQCADLHQVGI
uniref:Uncharacterized protein n=1 Tax=Bactrocera latifrons TaxID=174628 RepID=A0A0K8WER7_BACLA